MFLEKNRFRANSPRVYGGRSVINLKTRQNGVQLGWTGWTVRGAQEDKLTHMTCITSSHHQAN
jgi:hypothetical protein